MPAQDKLFADRASPAKRTGPKAADRDSRNLETARWILENPDAHGGAEAFAAQWARAVIDRLAPPARQRR
jgi:hypothetical protein